MSEPREAVAAYLRSREARGDPEIFLTQGERSRLLAGLRLGASGVERGAEGAARLGRLSRTGRREDILSIPDLPSLRAVAESCTRCELSATRTHVVFANGSESARVVCVGEAPGANEDSTGQPFVGRAGKLLDQLLLSVGLPREEVFVCNVLKCRPPGNRNPLPEEIEACSPFMLRQLHLVRPKVIVALGTFAAQTLLETRESLGRLRGRTHLFQEFPLVVTYHPAALLRNPGWTRSTWEDLQRVRRLADGIEDGVGFDSRRTARSDTGPAQPIADEPPGQLTFGAVDG